MKMPLLALLAVSLWSVVPSAAATDTYWSAISTGCVPDSSSIQANRYRDVSDSALQHQTGNVDKIVLVCGVAPNPGAALPNLLAMTYLDSTGNGTKAQVIAELMRVNRNTAAVSTIAAVTSNTFLTKTMTLGKSPLFNHQLNFDTSYYFVRITVDRTTTAQDVRSVGVALEISPP
jgi:hypothetical protein